MKRGYIHLVNSVTELQTAINRMNDVGVASEMITINKSFDEFCEMLNAGDCAIVYSLDCFHSLAELMNATIKLSEREIRLRSFTESWYDNSPESLVMLNGLVELTTRIHTHRTRSGLAKAKAQGKKLGRPVGSVKLKEKVAKVKELRKKSKISVAKACDAVKCNLRSYYRYIKEV